MMSAQSSLSIDLNETIATERKIKKNYHCVGTIG